MPALNNGLAFEFAVMYAATSRIEIRDKDQEEAFQEAAAKWPLIPQEIKDKATEIVLGLAPKLKAQRQTFFKSFKKMSGGDEPKTDILFKKGGKKYKCSMKWGNSFQLSSAKVDSTVDYITKVLKKCAADLGKNGMTTDQLGSLQLILEQISNKFENATGTVTAPEADRMMKDVNKAGGLNEQLQEILGSKKSPGTAYDTFKFELTKECMTGNLTFATDKDKAANYLLTENGLKPINDAAIREVMAVAGVRFSKKGRGTDKATGVRKNQISIRYEV
jgi:hypothetical protein